MALLVDRGGSEFVLKIASSPEDSARLEAEADVLGRLRHQSVVAVEAILRFGERVGLLLQKAGKELPQPRPLATHRFATDGVRLFVEAFGHVVDISSGAQLLVPDLLERYLTRIEHDESGLAARLYPFTRRREGDSPAMIVIDARLVRGRDKSQLRGRDLLRTPGIPGGMGATLFWRGIPWAVGLDRRKR